MGDNTNKSNLIKTLRQETGIGIFFCKKALEQCNFDYDKAKMLLLKRSRNWI